MPMENLRFTVMVWGKSRRSLETLLRPPQNAMGREGRYVILIKRLTLLFCGVILHVMEGEHFTLPRRLRCSAF